MNTHKIQCKKQTGSALIVSLSILLVLTILGVSAMRTTSLEEKMAGNSRDAQMAFEAAESALRSAEAFIIASGGDISGYTGAGAYHGMRGPGNPESWTLEANWATAVQVPYSVQVARLPRYMIQLVNSAAELSQAADSGNAQLYGKGEPVPNTYQITARGTGISPNSRAMLQAHYISF